MKKALTRFFLSLVVLHVLSAQANDCLDEQSLRTLDQHYEEALRVSDITYLQNLLADNFLWVHNLAVETENKATLLNRLKIQSRSEAPKARTTSDLAFHRLENTVVISGLSSVEKYNADGKNTRISHYRFMRSYVKTSTNQCLLLATQTMKVFSSVPSPSEDKTKRKFP